MKPITSTPSRGLIFVLITLFLDIMGSTLLMPIVPYIIREYNSDALTVGLLSALYAAAAFLAAPLLGKFSDRFGRRPVLLISVLGSAFGYFLFGIGGALWVLFLSRLIDGFTGGNISTTMAYIADVTPPKERARNFAFGGVAFGLGFFIGPVISGSLSAISLSAPAFAAGGMSLAAFLFGLFFLPESLPPQKRSHAPFRLAEMNPFSVMLEMGRLPNLARLFTGIFILYLALNGLFSYIAVYTMQRFSVGPSQNASLFMVVGIVQMVGQGLFVYRLTPRLGEKKVSLIGLTLQALAYPLFVVVPSFALVLPLAAFSALGNALSRPTLDAMIANSVASHEQGRAAGVSTGLYSLTSVLGPLLFGLVYDSVSPAAVFIIAGLLICAAGLVVSRLRIPVMSNS
ncbi:MAG: MFS transporter [Anaerolineaceae bacterium]|nr:MFS transporter [Anaerolineaceae bacterium]